MEQKISGKEVKETPKPLKKENMFLNMKKLLCNSYKKWKTIPTA